jgi:hypothetical protein
MICPSSDREESIFMSKCVEKFCELRIKKKPKILPKWFWNWIVNRVIYIEYFKKDLEI